MMRGAERLNCPTRAATHTRTKKKLVALSFLAVSFAHAQIEHPQAIASSLSLQLLCHLAPAPLYVQVGYIFWILIA